MAVICPKCKNDNPYPVKFCGECGAKLGPANDISITKTLRTPAKTKTIAGKYKILEELGRDDKKSLRGRSLDLP